LVEKMRAELMGFNLVQVIGEVLAAAKVNRRWLRAVEEVFEGKEVDHGVASFVALEGDEEVEERLDVVGAKARKNLPFLLAVRRLLKRAPQDDEGRAALLQWCYDVIGLDMDTYRRAVADLPTGGVLFWGAVADMGQLTGQFAREVFELYVSLVLGVRMESRFSEEYPESFRDLVQVCVDPAVTHLAFAGHGTWSSMSMGGVYQHPDKTFAKLCAQAKRSPREFATDLAKWSVRGLGRRHHDSLSEPELAELVKALGGPLKQVVVRYTCGTQRYLGPNRLLWMLLPEELREQVRPEGAFIGPKEPDSEFEDALGDWLAEVAPGVEIVERAPFGACLVARRQDTHGYQGLTWIHHFIDEPLPGPPPTAGFVSAPVPEPPVPEGSSVVSE